MTAKNFPDSASAEEIRIWWRNITYDLGSFLSHVLISSNALSEAPLELKLGDIRPLKEEKEEEGREDDSVLTVREVSSSFGRCYVFKSAVKFKASEHMSFVFNASILHGRRLPFYLYEHGDAGLMGNYWVKLNALQGSTAQNFFSVLFRLFGVQMTEVFSGSLEQGETLDLPITKKEVR